VNIWMATPKPRLARSTTTRVTTRPLSSVTGHQVKDRRENFEIEWPKCAVYVGIQTPVVREGLQGDQQVSLVVPLSKRIEHDVIPEPKAEGRC